MYRVCRGFRENRVYRVYRVLRVLGFGFRVGMFAPLY